MRVALVAIMAVVVGCSSQTVNVDDPATRQMLSLLMPAKIIVEPFSGLKSFDDDDVPDGLEVVLRPVDSFGDPVKVAGVFRISLAHFRPASGLNQGDPIEQWDVAISTVGDQQAYWNRFTQMYEIPLELDLGTVAPDDRYVIEVTYNTPLGEHMITEYEFEPPPHRGAGLAES